jgi:uncharacterized protein YpmB
MQKNIIIAVLVLAVIGAGIYIYQDQQKESASIRIGGSEIRIETE